MKNEARIHNRLTALLAELPPESIRLVEQFAQFLRDQVQKDHNLSKAEETVEHKPYLYPTVAVPSDLIDCMVGMMIPVGGNALKDAEALYDSH